MILLTTYFIIPKVLVFEKKILFNLKPLKNNILKKVYIFIVIMFVFTILNDYELMIYYILLISYKQNIFTRILIIKFRMSN